MSNFVITGSTKGIGFALAKYCLKRGDNVLVSGRTEDAVNAALAKLADSGSGRAMGRIADVSNKADVQALWDAAAAEFGTVDVWINNAGVANTTKAIAEISEADVRNMVSSNMLGTTFGCQVAAKGMLAQGKGRIFNVLGGGSDGEFFPGMGVYGSTKRGLDYLTRALAKELKDSAIVVGRVRPGMVISEGMIREIKADPENFAKSRKIMNILGDKPETVAPFLIENILTMSKSGGKVAWLSGGKIASRFLLARLKPRADLFADVSI
ncbi:MAG: SDR family oxidoreductase [Oceanococcus sp.]